MGEPAPSSCTLVSRRVVYAGRLQPAAVRVASGTIAAVTPPDQSTEEAPGDEPRFDFGDLVIGPGLVDAHVHINEPGRAAWEGFRTATAAAAAGGVTTLIDMPLNSSPVTTTPEALLAKRSAAADQCSVDVAFYGGLIAGGADNAVALLAEGVCGLKAFLCDSGLDEFPAAREQDLRDAAPALARAGAPLLVHAELPLTPGPTLTDPRRYAEYLASRPKRWETDAITMLIRVCRDTGCRVHVVHLANADAIAITDQARRDGLPLTVETCPHYLHFAADEVPPGDTRFKCAPPIRESSHREELWRGLSAGSIDTVGSDHSPCPPELKHAETGDFLAAWGGVAGLQLTLPVLVTGAARRGVPLESVFEWASRRPAELFGLGDRKGRIAKGYDADLVVFDPEADWRVDGQRLLHRHKVTPYDGQALKGVAVETFVNGQRVYAGGRVNHDPGGRLLKAQF
ncbi:MAG: allantoinase AllB [Planctomycetota bacterium]